jgi:hypothetical protein
MLIDFCFVEPNVAAFDGKNQSFLDFVRGNIPPMVVDVDATLNPRQLRTGSCDELKHIRMVEIKMTYNSSILIDPTTPQDFVEGGVDLGEGHRARCHKTLAILRSFATNLGEVYRNARSIA